MAFLFAMPAFAQSPKEWRDSLDVLKQRIAVSPYSSDLHLKKAAVNIELSQWDYAIDEYSFILDKEPDCIAARYYRAYANNHLRRYDLARTDYEYVLKLVPTNFEARLGLSYTLQQLGRDKEALSQLNQMTLMAPDSAVVWASRAALEKSLNALDAALLDWDEAIRLAPDNTGYMLSKVEILIALGRKQEAKKQLDEIGAKGIPQGMLLKWYARCK